ncbi:MAG: VOC family protein [Myxococcota bacterium]
MRTLHTAFRVDDIARSLAFYGALGFIEVGRVAPQPGLTLIMLRLPDDRAVSLELVHDPDAGPLVVGTGFHHLVVQVEQLDPLLAALRAAGIAHEVPARPGGPDGPYTAFLTDPDGWRLELVQWPDGHGDGMTEADFR